MSAFKVLFFDLDDTLYPSSTGLWDLIGERINQYMILRLGLPAEGIGELRETLFRQYGTTLRGLKITRGIDERDYLDFVHDVPVHQYLQPIEGLPEMLDNLPQKRLVFTNADANHARRVLTALGISDQFQEIIDILDISPYCKPQPEAYQNALKLAGVDDPGEVVVIDDSMRNLASAKSLGCATIHVGPTLNHGDAHVSIPHILALPEAMQQLEKLWQMK